jgi:hypothetical protein
MTPFSSFLKKSIPVIAVTVFLLTTGLPVHGQRTKMNVLTHKYSKGDRYRISVNHYRTFTTTGEKLNQASYGETGYDIYLDIIESDGDVMDVQAQVEITRVTKDGKNLTYQLSQSLKQAPWLFAFDKFGSILPESVKPASVGNDPVDTSWVREFGLFLVQLPDYPVKIGDQWNIAKSDLADRFVKTVNEKISLTKTLMKGHYRLESIDDGVAMITIDVEVSGSGKIRESDRASMDLELLIHMMGSYYLNIASGKLVNGQITSELAAIGTHAGKEVEFSGTQTINFNNEKSK